MDARAQKISATMRAKKLDNFKVWRDQMKAEGKIKSSYEPFERNGDLAELIGCVLGDGHIYKHERCESLRITGDCQKPEFVFRYAILVENIFSKKPTIAKVKASNAMTITIYQKAISSRLGFPAGSRGACTYRLPRWIKGNKKYRVRFLRGLYEAEGSIHHHRKTCTHKLIFTNANTHLLALVFELVQALGFHPHTSYRKVQISRKEEVQKLADLLQFRNYRA